VLDEVGSPRGPGLGDGDEAAPLAPLGAVDLHEDTVTLDPGDLALHLEPLGQHRPLDLGGRLGQIVVGRAHHQRLEPDRAGAARRLDHPGGDPVPDLDGQLAVLVDQVGALDEPLLLRAEGDEHVGLADLGDDHINLGAHARRRAPPVVGRGLCQQRRERLGLLFTTHGINLSKNRPGAGRRTLPNPAALDQPKPPRR
jgi:hypothetical protein